MADHLPDEIETAIQHLVKAARIGGAQATASVSVADAELRAAVITVLTDVDRRRARAEHDAWATLFAENEVLRARCERLRQGVLYASRMGSPDLLFGMHILESDMADDLGPTADEGKRP